MDVAITQDGSEAVVRITGRVDTTTAPQLERELAGVADDVLRVVLDIGDVRYVASSGLRVFLATLKRQRAKGGTVVIREAAPLVMEVLDATGFTEIFEFED